MAKIVEQNTLIYVCVGVIFRQITLKKPPKSSLGSSKIFSKSLDAHGRF
jgi:hypothetical protein